jgi:hypothetical protein
MKANGFQAKKTLAILHDMLVYTTVKEQDLMKNPITKQQKQSSFCQG